MIAGVDRFVLDGASDKATWRNAKWKGGVVAALWLFGGVEGKGARLLLYGVQYFGHTVGRH